MASHSIQLPSLDPSKSTQVNCKTGEHHLPGPDSSHTHRLRSTPNVPLLFDVQSSPNPYSIQADLMTGVKVSPHIQPELTDSLLSDSDKSSVHPPAPGGDAPHKEQYSPSFSKPSLRHSKSFEASVSNSCNSLRAVPQSQSVNASTTRNLQRVLSSHQRTLSVTKDDPNHSAPRDISFYRFDTNIQIHDKESTPCETGIDVVTPITSNHQSVFTNEIEFSLAPQILHSAQGSKSRGAKSSNFFDATASIDQSLTLTEVQTGEFSVPHAVAGPPRDSSIPLLQSDSTGQVSITKPLVPLQNNVSDRSSSVTVSVTPEVNHLTKQIEGSEPMLNSEFLLAEEASEQLHVDGVAVNVTDFRRQRNVSFRLEKNFEPDQSGSAENLHHGNFPTFGENTFVGPTDTSSAGRLRLSGSMEVTTGKIHIQTEDLRSLSQEYSSQSRAVCVDSDVSLLYQKGLSNMLSDKLDVRTDQECLLTSNTDTVQKSRNRSSNSLSCDNENEDGIIYNSQTNHTSVESNSLCIFRDECEYGDSLSIYKKSSTDSILVGASTQSRTENCGKGVYKEHSSEGEDLDIEGTNVESDGAESNESDSSLEYTVRRRLHNDDDTDDNIDNEIDDDSSSEEENAAGMALAKMMRENFARKHQFGPTGNTGNRDAHLMSECSITDSGGDGDLAAENSADNTQWRLLKSKSIKCLRRSRSKRRASTVLPKLQNMRFGEEHQTVCSEGVYQERPVIMDLPTTRRLTFWMIDGPEEGEDDDDDESTDDEEFKTRKLGKSRNNGRKRNAAQLTSFVLFSCTEPGPPARVGLISPLQKTVIFPCVGEENENSEAALDYVSLAKPSELRNPATEACVGFAERDLKFIDDPDFIDDEDFEIGDGNILSCGGKAIGLHRSATGIQRGKIKTLEGTSIDCRETHITIVNPTDANMNKVDHTVVTGSGEFGKKSSPVGDSLKTKIVDTTEKDPTLDCTNTMMRNDQTENDLSAQDEKADNHDGNMKAHLSGLIGISGNIGNDSENPSLLKLRRYDSRSCSGSSDEAWRNLEGDQTVDECGRDLCCRRLSYTDVVNRSIHSVAYMFKNNVAFGNRATNVRIGSSEADESDDERLFRETVCNTEITQKILTEDELALADLELDLENVQLETSKMEAMLLGWVDRLEGEKADILYKERQLEEQLMLQREKDQTDKILRDRVTGGRALQLGPRNEEGLEGIEALRRELDEERKRSDTLKYENERLLLVISRLQQELDGQMDRQQKSIEGEKMLQQTIEMLEMEREERCRLERLVLEMESEKCSRGSTPSSQKAGKSRRKLLWWT